MGRLFYSKLKVFVKMVDKLFCHRVFRLNFLLLFLTCLSHCKTSKDNHKTDGNAAHALDRHHDYSNQSNVKYQSNGNTPKNALATHAIRNHLSNDKSQQDDLRNQKSPSDTGITFGEKVNTTTGCYANQRKVHRPFPFFPFFAFYKIGMN